MRESDFAARVVAAALAMVGAPFRLHGRMPEHGVDCVGLVQLAYRQAGHRANAPLAYGLRSGNDGHAGRWLAEAGLRSVDDTGQGDVVLVRPGPLQLHLMIAVPDGHVHAHAGIGQVVETPGEAPWPVIGRWRAIQE